MLNDYDSFVPVEIPGQPSDSFVEEMVPMPPVQGPITLHKPTLKCPFCSNKEVFNPESIQRVKNFNCPTCKSNVPSSTLVKMANENYESSLEIISDDQKFIEDLKGSLKVIRDYGDEPKEKKN